jgi:hypothetical protein
MTFFVLTGMISGGSASENDNDNFFDDNVVEILRNILGLTKLEDDFAF